VLQLALHTKAAKLKIHPRLPIPI